MQQINKQARKILLAIIDDLKGETYKKYNLHNHPEGCIMPLVVEIKATGLKHQSNKNCFVVSLAHYYEQNGDLMSDPYMEFLVSDYRHLIEPDAKRTENQILDMVGIWPSVFEQSGIFGRYEELIIFEDGETKRYSKTRQPDAAVFAGMWLKNIKHQQKIVVELSRTPSTFGKQLQTA